ncbi:hypothetical protein [Streptomyces sp. SHP 1-2]|uniref:hypothetical protein n=1 Tax=Streptomyces sp. SHP 1-2 TaxID=2769489 RepID=UPI0022372C68|nr:hypothetical protein [Streptomyces sp. SHP 1-2]MCW5250106.1 hypothetical protein [Streptomyces sp. SHP 1-2]
MSWLTVSGTAYDLGICVDHSKIGPTMPALTDPLDDAQLALLKVMAEQYLKSGQWPFWRYVEQMMDHLGYDDAEQVLKSLPVVGANSPVGRSYGLAWYDRVHLADDSRPALTVAAGLHSPELRHVFGDNFISVLQYFIKHQRAVRPSPDKVEAAYVTSDDFKRDFPAVTDEFVAALPGIFEHEPVLRRGSQPWGTNPARWRFELHKWLKDYRGVDDLPGYVERITEITLAANTLIIPESRAPELARVLGSSGGKIVIGPALSSPMPTVTGAITPRAVTPPEPKLYVNEGILTELSAKQGKTKLNLKKLLQLLRELDDAYADDHPYSCHALLRAIIDHVPPILGHKSFESAVNNYTWTRTDKKYVSRLLEFKTQADDVLHRQIRESADVITMYDLPQAAALNALLRVCIDKL